MLHRSLAFAAVFVSLQGAACSASSPDELFGRRDDSVVLDVRCAADTDCPSGYECEIERTTSYCRSHGRSGDASPGNGHDAGAEDDGDSGTSPSSAASCTSDADCGPGLECEVETEHGVTTSFCKAHRSGKGR